ncbi:MAG: PIG-L deacetylase family protein [Candidatus Helarchaeota archaeon]
MRLKILAIGAHPDDLEILAGGTLIKYNDFGCEINLVIVTDGTAGHGIINPDELKIIRRNEAEKTANFLNATMYWLGMRDEFIFPNKDLRMKIVDVIRQTKPDLIITHSPNDYHPDHVNLSKTILDASFVSTLPNIKTKFKNNSKVVPIYYMDTLAGINFSPDYYVDITDQFKRKQQILQFHSSQVQWLKDHDNIDIVEFIEVIARFRGLQSGVKYAEGFKQAKVWPRLGTRRLLP